MKKGRFSKSEISFIKSNCENLSYEELGTKLDRDPERHGAAVVIKINKITKMRTQKTKISLIK